MSKNSMEQIVYDKIKEAIVKKKVRPGTQLIESTLAENLNTSRTPIRNALKRLEKEGFVIIIANRGAFIIEPKKQEIIDAFTVRMELENLALELGLKDIKGEISILENLLQKERLVLKQNDIISYLEVNKEFHLSIARFSKNRFLVEFLEKIINQINVYLLLYDTYYHASLESITSTKEHEQIIKLIKNKNMEEVKVYYRKHLEDSLKDIDIEKIDNHSLHNIL